MTSLPQLLTTAPRQALAALNRMVMPALDRGFGTPLPIGLGAVVVETTGRLSGRPRHVPVLAARLGDRIVVSTVRSNSHWLANLEASPVARVTLHGDPHEVHACVQRGPLNVAVLDLI